MIQFKIKDKDNKVLRVTSPSSWSELNLQQLIELETEWDGVNPLKLFGIVTGVNVDILANSKQKDLEDKLNAICAFAYNEPLWDKLSKPNLIQIGDQVYKVPTDISKKTLGQKLMINQIAIKEGKELITNIPKIIAIYMQEVVDGKFEDERITDIEKLILNSSAMECFALARFFFLQSKISMSIGEDNLQKSQQRTIPIGRLLNGLQMLRG